ncbi:hypothetical protein PMIN01_01611 [Paraphaeosphaeria minitans]|uniref:Transmembrane protein n=1 Tax=Paraphaeosphaeria minitans TaxID=565426 RepID=A0A9P6GNJ2_9PLEO|nr:hypothetical protein PMIN01_01611 [Paraphaeosphaeria minitans]
MDERKCMLKHQHDVEISERHTSFSLDDVLTSPRHCNTRLAFFVFSNVAHVLCIAALCLSYRNNRACTLR